jgi:phosphohistidine phosphatase
VKLYIMRHGPAEDRAKSGIDADRALTASGRLRVRSVAEALRDAGEEPRRILTSPLIRAAQTADIVALETKPSDRDGSVTPCLELKPGGPSAQWVGELVSAGGRRVMIVGHEPDLSALVGMLTAAPFDRPFDKAMVVGLHAGPDRCARVRFILDPKTLRFDR